MDIAKLLRENGVPEDKLQSVANDIVLGALFGAELYNEPGRIYLKYPSGRTEDVFTKG